MAQQPTKRIVGRGEVQSPTERNVHARRDGLVLIAILLVAAALRLYAVETANFWHDEFWTLELSCGRDTAHEHLPTNVLLPSLPVLTSPAEALPLWHFAGSLSEVTHPPLFFLLLRFWRDVLGPSDMAARLLPCLASVCAIGLFYRVVRQVNGPGAAGWACLIMALSGQQIFYAQEVRSYSLIVLLGLAALGSLIEIDQRGASPLRLGVFGLLALALVMTHYFTIGLLIGLAVYAVVRLPNRSSLQVLVALAVAALIFAAVWGPFMLRQRGAMGLENEGGAAFLLERGAGHLVHTLERLIAVPAQSIAPATFMSPADLPPVIAWLALPAFLAPLVCLKNKRDLLVWYFWVAGVVMPILLLDVFRSSMHMAFPRYTLLAGPGVFAVIAAGFDRIKSPWRHAAPAAVVVASLLLLPAALREPGSKKDWQPIADAAAQSMQPGDPLVFTAPPDRAPLVYLYVSHYLGEMNRPVAIVTRPVSRELDAQLKAHSRVWVISAWAQLPPLFPGAHVEPMASTEMADFGRLQRTR